MNASIHRVKEVIIRETSRIERDNGSEFFVRHIEIWDDEGRAINLSLISDEKQTLELTGEGA